jgi:pilus assembly protein CpaE
MRQQFVALVEMENQLSWLRGALSQHGGVVAADHAEAGRIVQLIDSAAAPVLFVRFTPFEMGPRANLVQRVLERKPHLSVIALGETTDHALVLAAVRSGACDFVEMGGPVEELLEAVERALGRTSVERTSRGGGRIHALLNARPDGATAALATHLAIAMQRAAGPDKRVLLVDLGVPVGDSLLYLDVRATYSFTDAVRSVRRFDESLIHSAFARHASGLCVLPLPEDPSELEGIQMADAVALTGVLNAHFDHVIMNLAGFFDMERLVPILSQVTRLFVLADQCLASCRANHRLLERLRREKVELSRCELIVDRATERVEPKPAEIAELLGLKLLHSVASSGSLMIRAMNTGQTICSMAPSSSYALAVAQIAASVVHDTPIIEPGLLERIQRLWSGE